MSQDRFDILVVGAGPAGSFAAELIARAGKSVALFDGRPPREPKACGGGVTSKALKAWPHLFDTAGRLIEELALYSPNGRKIDLHLEEPFAIFSRITLDTYLRDRAKAAGAKVFSERVKLSIESCPSDWIVQNQQGEYRHGKLLVAADGANSAIGKKLAGALEPSEMEVAFGYRGPLTKGEVKTIVAFLPGWIGYAWAFPRIDHISFGIATTQDEFVHAALDRLLWMFMLHYYGGNGDLNCNWWIESENGVSKFKASMDNLVERYAARIPGLSAATMKQRAACGKGWALLGDAAGFADPVTGEGIYYALRSAELFALAYLAGDEMSYEASWRKDFGRQLVRASQMRSRFYGKFVYAPFTDRMIHFASVHAGIRKVLRDLVAGEQGYVGLKRQLLKKAFFPL